jgi:hypothetical protein
MREVLPFQHYAAGSPSILPYQMICIAGIAKSCCRTPPCLCSFVAALQPARHLPDLEADLEEPTLSSWSSLKPLPEGMLRHRS